MGKAEFWGVWDIGRGFLSWERGGEEKGECLLVVLENLSLTGSLCCNGKQISPYLKEAIFLKEYKEVSSSII